MVLSAGGLARVRARLTLLGAVSPRTLALLDPPLINTDDVYYGEYYCALNINDLNLELPGL